MNDLLQIIFDIALKLHPDRVDILAKEISLLNCVNDFKQIQNSSGFSVIKDEIRNLESIWKNSPEITPSEISYALRGASAASCRFDRNQSVEMVWSGPPTGLVPTRHTEQVLLEVIQSAEKRLFIASFVAYNIESIINCLEKAVCRNVKVDILLESSKSHGGKVNFDSILMFQKRIPIANIYAWKSYPGHKNITGAVHAKCILADDKIAFISSANLTTAAMECNMELGVLLKGGELTSRLNQHFNALIAIKVIEKI